MTGKMFQILPFKVIPRALDSSLLPPKRSSRRMRRNLEMGPGNVKRIRVLRTAANFDSAGKSRCPAKLLREKPVVPIEPPKTQAAFLGLGFFAL